MKELKESSDNKIIRGLIAERISELNPYTPLKERLQSLYNKYDDLVRKEAKKDEMKKIIRKLTS